MSAAGGMDSFQQMQAMNAGKHGSEGENNSGIIKAFGLELPTKHTLKDVDIGSGFSLQSLLGIGAMLEGAPSGSPFSIIGKIFFEMFDAPFANTADQGMGGGMGAAMSHGGNQDGSDGSATGSGGGGGGDAVFSAVDGLAKLTGGQEVPMQALGQLHPSPTPSGGFLGLGAGLGGAGRE